MDAVWKDAFVTDPSLAEAVSFLRQALGDDPQAPRYIQTVHRRGYRFVAPIVVPEIAEGVRPGPDPGLSRVRVGSDPGQSGVRVGSESAQSGVRVGSDPALVPRGEKSASLAPQRVAESATWWEHTPLFVVLLCLALGAGAAWRVSKDVPDPPPVARFEISASAGTAFDTRAPAMAVAPDGRTIAWAGCAESSGACALYIRAVDRFDNLKVAGTEGASHPFFSPDGRWIGFFADGKLKKIAAGGGAASILADATAPGGASWGPDDRILFAGSAAGGLSLVSSEGGAVTTLTTPRSDRGEVRHIYPAWLSSGGVIFTVAGIPIADAPGEVAALAPQGRDWTTLRSGVTRTAVAAPGYLLGTNGVDLQAATFDPRRLALTGGADSVLASIANTTSGIADFAIGGGTLAALAAPTERRATWTDGVDAGAIARLSSIAISPDSRRAAGVLIEGPSSDIWIADLPAGALTRMTYGGVNVSPAWSPDGTRLFFATRSNTGAFAIASRRIDERTITKVAAGDSHLFPSSIAPDGRIAVTTTSGAHTAVGIVPAGGGAVQLLQSAPFDEGAPAFSPDGRWLAIESSESGRREIVVRDPGGEARVAISTDGGTRPRWSADGRAIYFEADGRAMRAAFDPDRGVARAPETVGANAMGQVMAITPTGRVLTVRMAAPRRAFVVLQWLRELRERLPQPTTSPR